MELYLFIQKESVKEIGTFLEFGEKVSILKVGQLINWIQYYASFSLKHDQQRLYCIRRPHLSALDMG